jgi:DNA modification methylase
MFEKIISIDSERVIEVDKLPMDIENGVIYSINQPNPNSYTHGYFKYPCKFIPEIPRWAILKYVGENKGTILDPFSGSGTTILEALLTNNTAIGTEIDNFAKLLTKVKSTQLSNRDIETMKAIVNAILSWSNRYKEYNDYSIPEINNIYHWFPEEAVLKLGLIKNEIDKVTHIGIKNFLYICFGSIIRKCSNADDVSPKPYVSTKITKNPQDPFDQFSKVFNRYVFGIEQLAQISTIGNTKEISGHALDIPIKEEIDLAVTSPPYINAFDYARTLRLENLWLGLESEDSIRNKKKNYVGTENINSKEEIKNLNILNDSSILKDAFIKVRDKDLKRAIIVKKFFEDMKVNLEQIYNVLNKNGKYCIVIGDSTIRKERIESWKILIDIGEKIGFKLENYFGYEIKNHYLRIPRGNRGGKINHDFVIVLKK